MKPLTCAEAQLFLSDLLAHALEAEDRQRLDEHLSACEQCRLAGVALFRQDLLLVQAGSASNVDDLARRIQENLAAAVGRRRLAGWVGGLAASILVLLAVVGAFMLFQRSSEEAPIVRLDGAGDVFLVDGQDKIPVRSGHALAAGQALQTLGQDSRAVVRYEDATQLALGPNTTLQLLPGSPGPAQRQSAAEKRVFLREGIVTAQVSKQPADQPLVLVTPHAELIVLGTRFWVGATSEQTRVEVEEGAIQFRNKAEPQAVSVRAGEQAVAAAPATAQGSPWQERFETTEHLRVLQGYRAMNPRLELQVDDHREGQACVQVTWTSAPQGYGTGGVEKTFAAADFTGKSFHIWLKPLAPDTCATLAVALFDSRGLRAEVRFVHLTAREWVQLVIPVGQKGKWSAYQKSPAADLTHISRIEFYGITRGPNQLGGLLVDGFEEIQAR